MPQDKLESVLLKRKLPAIKDPDAFDRYKDAIHMDIDPESGVAPTAPQFRPYPDVRGDSSFANTVDSLIKRFPELQGLAKTITHGPNAISISDMVRSKLNPDEFEDTNLLGITNVNGPKNIAISPRLDGQQAMSTVGHELAHARGYGEGDTQILTNNLDKALDLQTYKTMSIPELLKEYPGLAKLLNKKNK